MPEILTVDVPATGTPNTPTAPAPGIAEAGVALRANGFDVASVVPAVPVVPVVDPAAPVVPAAPVAPAAETPADPAADATFTQDETGKWHRSDGSFANAEEIAALNALPADGSADVAPPEEPTPEPIVVALKGRRGEEREIEVTDPEIAELLRANANDGMRRDEFVRQSEAMAVDKAGIDEFKTAMRTNPEAVILNEIPPDKQIAVAVALIAQHWDAIAAQLVAFDTDPTERLKAAMATQHTIREQERSLATARSASAYSAQVYTAVNALVPATADETVREQFISDAAQDIARAIAANGKQPVAVDKIPELLARRVALYRFTEASSPTAGTGAPAVTPPARPVARPLARPSTTSASVPSVPVPAQASAPALVRRTIKAQRIAAAVAPQGAGAATVKAPLIPSNADVTAASQTMRQQKGWGLG